MARNPSRTWSIALLVFLVFVLSSVAHALTPQVLLVDIEGPIGPATAQHVSGALADARDDDARAVVLRIDTPGGLDTSMRDIVRDIVASPVPVVGYVAPSGARAASAGTYILMATHVAAMAPATTLGAATPVRIGGGAPTPQPQGDSDAMDRKVVEDARAYMRGLANLRGRNAQWAENAVTEGASATASEAVRDGVVDVLAGDVDELLERIDGRRVDVLGVPVSLQTAGAPVRTHEASWHNRLLSIIGDPNIAYLLLMLGVFGLVLELSNPGVFVPGIVGAICLVLALFALAALPVNWAGLALIMLGVGLMIAEVFVASMGVLGIGGIAAFVAGSIILFDTDSEFFQLSLGLVIGIAVASAVIFIGVVRLAVKSRRGKVVSGREELLGASALALEPFDDAGRVRVHGEIWNARTEHPVLEGDRLRVRAIDGLTLAVEPAELSERTRDESLYVTSKQNEETHP